MSDTNEELEARLARARLAKAEAEAKRAARAEERRLLEDVERAEIEAANAAALAAAEEKIGPLGEAIGTVDTHGGIVIVHRPNALFYQVITREIGSKNEQKAEAAAHRLIEKCLVHPEKPQYEALVEKYPALPGVLIGLIAKLAAGGASVTGE